MASKNVVKFFWFVCGLVIVFGASIGVGVLDLVVNSSKNSSSNDDDVSNSTNSTGSRVQDSLQMVVVVSRHGNRGGYIDYPGDPYPRDNTTFWPYGENSLTKYGREQEYKLGLKLRSLYNGFLPTVFHPADVRASSDLVERVMMSGELVLAGLYPPEDWQVWNTSVLWQPIPLYTDSPDHTNDVSSCERFQLDKNTSVANFSARESVNVSAINEYLFNVTGENYTVDDLFLLYDKLYSEVTEGYALPEWTTTVYPAPLATLVAGYCYAFNAATVEMVRLNIGELYEEVVEAMSRKASGLSDRLLVYYSGHDYSVLTLQAALGVADDDLVSLVKTGSALVLELHEDSASNQSYVEVLYIDGSALDSDPSSLSLPDCGDPCTLQALINSTTKFTNVSYDEECLTVASNTQTQTFLLSGIQ